MQYFHNSLAQNYLHFRCGTNDSMVWFPDTLGIYAQFSRNLSQNALHTYNNHDFGFAGILLIRGESFTNTWHKHSIIGASRDHLSPSWFSQYIKYNISFIYWNDSEKCPHRFICLFATLIARMTCDFTTNVLDTLYTPRELTTAHGAHTFLTLLT